MFEFLKHLFPTEEGDVPPEDRRLVEIAIEAIVDRTDPRLRALSDYRRRLGPAVEEAILHTRLVVARLRPPVAIDRRAFVDDPLVHLLFGAADSMASIAGRDPNVRAFLASPHGRDADEIFALLLAGRREKTVFGSRLEGELVVADMPQRMVSFANHRLHAVSRSESHTLSLTGRLVFRQLIRHALEHMQARRQGGHGLEAGGYRVTGEDPFSRSAWAGETPPRGEGNGHPGAAPAPFRPAPTLEDYLDDVVSVMQEPARHLHHRRHGLEVDRMGILRPSRQAAGDYDKVAYWEATPDTGVGPLATVLVRMPVDQIAPAATGDVLLL